MPPPDPTREDDLDRLADRLAAWAPTPPAVARDRVLFEAGAAAGRREARRQAAVVVAALTLAAGAGFIHQHRVQTALQVALAGRPPVAVSVRAETRPDPTPRPDLAASRPAPSSYLALSHLYAGEPGRIEPVDPLPPRRSTPTPVGPILTPLSSRHFANNFDL